MPYAITNGYAYLNQKCETSRDMYTWEKEKAAQNFLKTYRKSKCKGAVGYSYWVVDADKFQLKPQYTPKNYPPLPEQKEQEAVENSITENIEKGEETALQYPENIHEDDAILLFSEAYETIRKIKQRVAYLSSKVSDIEKEIVDIEHFIELETVQNAAGGYKLYRKLRELLSERRYCKDQIEILSAGQSAGWNEDFLKVANEAKSSLDNRIYTVRSSGEVARFFDNSQIPHKYG